MFYLIRLCLLSNRSSGYLGFCNVEKSAEELTQQNLSYLSFRIHTIVTYTCGNSYIYVYVYIPTHKLKTFFMDKNTL